MMMTDSEITVVSVRAELAALLAELGKQRLAFVEALKAWSPQWWDQRARNVVIGAPLVTERLSDYELRELRSHLMSLWDREPGLLLGNLVNDPKVWWDLNPWVQQSDFGAQTCTPPDERGCFEPIDGWGNHYLEGMIGRVLGCAIPVFQAYGYETNLFHPSAKNFYSICTVERTLNMPVNMRELISNYRRLRVRAASRINAICYYSMDRLCRDAEERWDRIAKTSV